MTSHEADSPSSTPRSDQPHEPRVRLMCSFDGRILPRPHDNQLRYVGGDTRIVAVHRSTTFAALQAKLSKLSNNPSDVTLKYQLPNEDLDSLISVTTDEDVDNMIEEYDRLILHHHHSGSATKTPRLRLFLFSNETASNNSSIGSLLGGSSKRESWFLDALNGQGLERGRSEVSSIISEVPDYLFGLDNSDDSKPPKHRPVLSENLSVVSDPGSPAPPVSSPYCSTTSSPMPDLPPVKTKVETQVELKETQMGTEPVQAVPQQAGFGANPVWHYLPEANMHGPGSGMQPVPVYYVPAPAGNVPVRPMAMHMPYAHQAPAAVGVGQIPMGFSHPVQGQVYGGPGMAVVRQTVEGYEFPVGVGPDVVAHQQQQQAYYVAARNAGAYPTAGIAGEMQQQGGGGPETKIGRISQSR